MKSRCCSCFHGIQVSPFSFKKHAWSTSKALLGIHLPHLAVRSMSILHVFSHICLVQILYPSTLQDLITFLGHFFHIQYQFFTLIFIDFLASLDASLQSMSTFAAQNPLAVSSRSAAGRCRPLVGKVECSLEHFKKNVET